MLSNNNFKHYSKNTSFGAVFVKRFEISFRDLLKRPVFERRDATWIDILSVKTKYNFQVHTSSKLTTKQASFKKNDGYVNHILLDKRQKIKPKF